MNKIKVMVNGIPGNMASNVAKHVLKDDLFKLISYSLTGQEVIVDEAAVGSRKIALIRPDRKEEVIAIIQKNEGAFISVDFTCPLAINPNVEFYCKYGLPFVMGTTGGNGELLKKVVEASSISAVIAPNMAGSVIGFQAMMKFAADTFPGLFAGYSLQIKESHQKNKVDTSGTAKAMVRYFTKLGTLFSEDMIIKERDPEAQIRLGVPEEYLSGHGWHDYMLISPDGSVKIEFVHNINGRDVYARGTLDAILFLDKKVKKGIIGRVFSMIDVLEGK